MVESLERAIADLELVVSAFPDEIDQEDEDYSAVQTLPLHLTLRLSETAHIKLEWSDGFPESSNVKVSSYRSSRSEKAIIDEVLQSIQLKSAECLADGIEGGLSCCMAATETWNDTNEARQTHDLRKTRDSVEDPVALSSPHPSFQWVVGEPLLDRKSTFLGHACRIESQDDVAIALQELLSSHPKYRRATHNMFAWRLHDADTGLLKYDNDDDGEDAAGSRLAHLLELRKETAALVVVSRWYGGVHLGPKRFAHITNTARDILVQLRDSEKANKVMI